MRIVKLKIGYSIRLTDGEYEALQHLVELGIGDMEGTAEEEQTASLSLAGKQAMSRFMRYSMWQVADNRRASLIN